MTTQFTPINKKTANIKYFQPSRTHNIFQFDTKFLTLKRFSKKRQASIKMMTMLQSKHSFRDDTLLMAVHILDQLILNEFEDPFEDASFIGGVLILMTTKYNEVYPVTIDKINLSIPRFYRRQAFYELEELILEAINFTLPDETIYSKMDEMIQIEGKRKVRQWNENKENELNGSNSDTDCSELSLVNDKKELGRKILEVVSCVQVYKYGTSILLNALAGYLLKQKINSIATDDIKTHQIKSLIQKILQQNNPVNIDQISWTEKPTSQPIIPAFNNLSQSLSHSNLHQSATLNQSTVTNQNKPQRKRIFIF